jgi:hypothetical protein
LWVLRDRSAAHVFGVGYSVFGGLGDALSGIGQGLDIDGGNLRLGFGLDYFLTNTWSIGVRATGELLFLSRTGVPIRDLARAQSVSTVREARTRLAEGEGTSAGTAFSITIGLVHFKAKPHKNVPTFSDRDVRTEYEPTTSETRPVTCPASRWCHPPLIADGVRAPVWMFTDACRLIRVSERYGDPESRDGRRRTILPSPTPCP